MLSASSRSILRSAKADSLACPIVALRYGRMSFSLLNEHSQLAIEIHTCNSPFDIWLKYAKQYATKEALNSGLFEI